MNSRKRALALMQPARRARGDEDAHGYIDALDADPQSTGIAQDLMVSRLVPRIYERWWRPALGALAKGVTGPGMAEEVRIARLLMGLGAGDSVLDLACGPGNFSREFARTAGPDGLVIGVDVSTTMLSRAAEDARRAGAGNLAFVRADATSLPFADAGFDAACCFAALHLMSEPHVVLDELTRVLKPGGRIAVMTSVRRQLTVRPLKPVLERASGMRIFESGEIVEALQERGFTDVHQRLAGMVQFVGGRRSRPEPGDGDE
jgi:ubiquinone/menaquinone biosynthesis C-methylase UbiE